VLHYGKPGTLEELVPGMTFTIEPMINAGRRDIKEMGDGWTIVTKDHSLSAQWEHTVLVTETGYEVLTLSAGSPPPPAFSSRPEPPVAGHCPLRHNMTDLPALRSKYRHDKQEILRSAATSGSSTRGVRATLLHTFRVDRRVVARPVAVRRVRRTLCLVAVGGFGRGELFPYSDVDVLLLLPDDQSPDTDERLKGQIEAFIGSCWDSRP
jgi:hypothetical protein